jgi:hypothetical protein
MINDSVQTTCFLKLARQITIKRVIRDDPDWRRHGAPFPGTTLPWISAVFRLQPEKADRKCEY